MIDGKTFGFIKEVASEYWGSYAKSPAFSDMAKGKETGHRIADEVDDRTFARLFSEPGLDIKREAAKSGRILARSMGDLWLKSNGIYNPINIKSGVVSNGQPNLVSMTKLLTRLLLRQIDSYYLLIIKFAAENGGYLPKIYFVDMLDYLDFVAFDAGPGQAMLKEKDFYEFLNSGKKPGRLSLQEKIGKCVEIIEDGHRRLIVNRKSTMDKLRTDFGRFSTGPINQSGLYFG